MRLKELRKQNKMTQQVVASKLGVSRSTVAMWETEQNEPDNQMLLQLSMLFNCSVDYLLGKSDDRIDEQMLDIVNQLPIELLETHGNILDAQKSYRTDALGVTVDETLGRDPGIKRGPASIGGVEGEILEKYRLLTPDQQKQAASYLDFLIASQEKKDT